MLPQWGNILLLIIIYQGREGRPGLAGKVGLSGDEVGV